MNRGRNTGAVSAATSKPSKDVDTVVATVERETEILSVLNV